jgi:hypothetical protein
VLARLFNVKFTFTRENVSELSHIHSGIFLYSSSELYKKYTKITFQLLLIGKGVEFSFISNLKEYNREIEYYAIGYNTIYKWMLTNR